LEKGSFPFNPNWEKNNEPLEGLRRRALINEELERRITIREERIGYNYSKKSK